MGGDRGADQIAGIMLEPTVMDGIRSYVFGNLQVVSVVAERTYSLNKNALQDQCFYEQVIIWIRADGIIHAFGE